MEQWHERVRCNTSRGHVTRRSPMHSSFSASAGTAFCSATLLNGPATFSELRRSVHGISDSMLSDRLGELSRAGLVSRTVNDGPPVAVDYALTPAGTALLPALDELTTWAAENLPACPGSTAARIRKVRRSPSHARRLGVALTRPGARGRCRDVLGPADYGVTPSRSSSGSIDAGIPGPPLGRGTHRVSDRDVVAGVANPTRGILPYNTS